MTDTEYWLHVTPAEGPPFERRLGEGALIVGRAAECDLALADPFLSRQHARIVRRGDAVEVEDLGSSNGTRVNGRPVNGPAALSPGDVVQLSATTLALHTGGGVPVRRGTEQSIYLDASVLLAEQARPLSEVATDAVLRRAAERLRLLNDIHEALARSLSRDELLELILDRAFGHFGPEEGAVYLRRDDGDGCVRAASRSTLAPGAPVLYSTSLEREVYGKGLAALVLDVATDERFAAAESMLSSGVRSLIAAPLLTEQGALGMIVLNSRLAAKRFSQDDLELLVSLASAAALRLRNMTLAAEAAERRRLAEEVALARKIQVALMPQRLPRPEGWELHADAAPSRVVSGDFYLALERAGGRELVFLVADVAGKGMSAALLMASLEALLGGPIARGLPPEEICAEVSPLLHQRTTAARYATAFLAVLEPATGALRHAGAGHNPAILVRAGGEVELLGSTGPPLGLLDGARYRAGDHRLGPGDLLVVYSDGIVEATDPADREYGLERLCELCRRERGEPLTDLGAAVEADLRAFAAGVPFADDRTLLLLRRGG